MINIIIETVNISIVVGGFLGIGIIYLILKYLLSNDFKWEKRIKSGNSNFWLAYNFIIDENSNQWVNKKTGKALDSVDVSEDNVFKKLDEGYKHLRSKRNFRCYRSA